MTLLEFYLGHAIALREDLELRRHRLMRETRTAAAAGDMPRAARLLEELSGVADDLGLMDAIRVGAIMRARISLPVLPADPAERRRMLEAEGEKWAKIAAGFDPTAAVSHEVASAVAALVRITARYLI